MNHRPPRRFGGNVVYSREMYQPLHAVILRTVRHSDTRLIVTAYTREAGRVTFALPDSSTAAGNRRRAMLMPLSVVECVGDIRPGREIHRLRDLRLSPPLPRLHLNPAKSAISMLLADVLATALREPQPDSLVYDFIAGGAMMLDGMTAGVANFHICFLIRLQQLLGIAPDMSGYRPGTQLDLAEGTVRADAAGPAAANSVLSVDDTAAAAALSRMHWRNLHLFKLSRDQRNAIIDTLLRYYTLHDIPLATIKSLSTLRQLF